MHHKRTSLPLLILIVILTITACSPPTISEVNCQPDDVTSNPPFLSIAEDAFVSANAPFPDHMTDYHRAALSENQLTVTDVLCTVRVYQDVDLATSALELLCLQSAGERTEESVGDAACGFQNAGIKEIHFRTGDTVVTVREDGGGFHAAQWAAAVDGRLN